MHARMTQEIIKRTLPNNQGGFFHITVSQKLFYIDTPIIAGLTTPSASEETP